jgi:hypothetical protein
MGSYYIPPDLCCLSKQQEMTVIDIITVKRKNVSEEIKQAKMRHMLLCTAKV